MAENGEPVHDFGELRDHQVVVSWPSRSLDTFKGDNLLTKLTDE